MKHWTRCVRAIALLLSLCSTPAWAQQPDTMYTCGFSRFDFSQLHPWFNPAAGRTSRVAALRAGPAVSAKLLKMIPAGKPVYLVSEAPRTRWYQAIDPATGTVGWMYDEGIEPEDYGVGIDSTTAAPGYDGPLRRTGCAKPVKDGGRHASLRIINHYAVPLKLLIDDKTYSVPRAITGKTAALQVDIKSGRQGYIIVVPDDEIVDVFFGYADLQATNCYQYEVEIQSIE